MKAFNEYEVTLKVDIILGDSQQATAYGKALLKSFETHLAQTYVPYENLGIVLTKVVD
jgi:hypothetical protein